MLYRFDGWVCDTGRRSLTNPAGAVVTLTASDFDLLALFCQHPQAELSRDMLIQTLLGRAIRPEDNFRMIDLRVNRLRAKIEANPRMPLVIKSIRHSGYWFAPKPEVVEA